MEKKYSIEEILSAVDEFQELKFSKKIDNESNESLKKNNDIPKDTLRIIEEAEKNIRSD